MAGLLEGLRTGADLARGAQQYDAQRNLNDWEEMIRSRQRQDFADQDAIKKAGVDSAMQPINAAGDPTVQPEGAPMTGSQAEDGPGPSGNPLDARHTVDLPPVVNPPDPRADQQAGPAPMKQAKSLDEMDQLNAVLMAQTRAAIKVGRPDLALEYQQQGMGLRDSLRSRAFDVAEAKFRATGDLGAYVPAFNRYVANGVNVDSVKQVDGKVIITGKTDEGRAFEQSLTPEQFAQQKAFIQDPKAARAMEAKRAEDLWKMTMDTQREVTKARAKGAEDRATEGIKAGYKSAEVTQKGSIDAANKAAELVQQGQISRALERLKQSGAVNLEGVKGANALERAKVIGEAIKPPNEGQVANAGYGARAAEADQIVSDIDTRMTKSGRAGLAVAQGVSGLPLIGGVIGAVGNALSSADQQMYDQAQRNFVNAVLRKESGAAISLTEFDNARKQYFPQPGDSDQVIEQKRKNRATTIQGFADGAGSLRPRIDGARNQAPAGLQQQGAPQAPQSGNLTGARKVDQALQAVEADEIPQGLPIGAVVTDNETGKTMVVTEQGLVER